MGGVVFDEVEGAVVVDGAAVDGVVLADADPDDADPDGAEEEPEDPAEPVEVGSGCTSLAGGAVTCTGTP